MAYKGKRSFKVGPWHYCSRCVEKTHISIMVWQRGLLLCPDCIDYGNNGFPLIGQREAAIIAAFEIPSTELQPDPKLSEPSEVTNDIDDSLIW